jgi:hypothetical protein
MSLENIHLRKLLKIMYLPPAKRTSALRGDIREDIARDSGVDAGGGDFYGPFWRDAKDHVFGLSDLHDSVEKRIIANPRRSNLYPKLRDGFLSWWNVSRRWTNEPFTPATNLKGIYRFPYLEAKVKVDNVLSVRDGHGENHFVYPYFSPEPILSEEAARLALWLLEQALPSTKSSEIRVLDVIRGHNFAPDKTPLHGNEEILFGSKYKVLLNEWRSLWSEYG